MNNKEENVQTFIVKSFGDDGWKHHGSVSLDINATEEIKLKKYEEIKKRFNIPNNDLLNVVNYCYVYL